MKTSLVVKAGDRYERAATPDDGADRKLIPRYIAAHRAHGSRHRNGRIEHEWNEKESVWTGHYAFRPRRGKVDCIRYLRLDIVDDLDKMDAERERLREEIKKLHEEEQTLLSMVFENGKRLTVEEVKAWRERLKEDA